MTQMSQTLATQQATVQQQVSAPTSAEKPKRARALNFEVTGPIHAALADRDLLPATHFVDAAHIDAGLLTSSKSEHQIDLCCATIKTPLLATIWHTSDGGAAFGGQASVKPEAAKGGGPEG